MKTPVNLYLFAVLNFSHYQAFPLKDCSIWKCYFVFLSKPYVKVYLQQTIVYVLMIHGVVFLKVLHRNSTIFSMLFSHQLTHKNIYIVNFLPAIFLVAIGI